MNSGKKPEDFIKTVKVELSPLPAWEHMPPHKRQAYFRREVRKLEKIDPRDRPKTPAEHTPRSSLSRVYAKGCR